ncbi:branched-chain amino acid ABC transporter permease [Leucobacter sp. UT-8R-CII-1-4]|uniref:branched-chain amino acid ABC transporter permease n=1 Tax=Leucobacter sp. UT-8R-CII-1-4 TaxID=3040075 RepID=UPI0024A7A66F|nr:branched-chain amino acid ABC transporter permease [Leucobacter sp. UT-8R-CII-1-4]MDI6023042.1 branched-chain amino acid ABC transporter permease [Leucobacter sp. UT-8R-CII-1-4]
MTRTTAISVSTRRPRSVALLLGLLLALLIVGGIVPVPGANAAECAPDASTGCLQGVIKTSDGEPAAGVVMQLSGNGEDQTVETGSDGKWAFAVTKSGSFTVTVDKNSLPEGQFLKLVESRDISVELGNAAGGLFPLTANADEANSGSSGGGDNAESGATTQAKSSFSWPRFWQQFASGLRLGLLIALASLGLSLIFGTTGLSNFAHGEMVSLGGLLAATFMGITGNLLLAALISVAAMALFGWAQDKLLWKPLRKRRLSLMQLMIVSIGLSITMQYLFQYFWGSGIIRIDSRNPATATIFGITMTIQSYVAMGISLVAIILVGAGLMFTRFGRATRAISDNPALAEASGINVDRVISVVWIVGGGLAGLSGVFLGLIFNGINWFTGGQMLLLFFAAVTLGGLGTAFGAFIGSMIIGMVVELTNIWLPGDLKFATALLILILILLVRPQGIFGRKERIG